MVYAGWIVVSEWWIDGVSVGMEGVMLLTRLPKLCNKL